MTSSPQDVIVCRKTLASPCRRLFCVTLVVHFMLGALCDGSLAGQLHKGYPPSIGRKLRDEFCNRLLGDVTRLALKSCRFSAKIRGLLCKIGDFFFFLGI